MGKEALNMSSDENEIISEERTSTAAELRRQAEEQKQKYKDNMKTFLKTGAFVLAAMVLIIVISMAWFAYNDSVKGTNSEVSVKYAGIEIGSKGDKSVHDDWLQKVYEDITYHLPGAEKKHDTSIGTGINWLLSDESNMNNYYGGQSFGDTHSEKRNTYAIEPGTRGYLNFFVKPYEDGDCSLDFQIDVIPYKVKNENINGGAEGDTTEEAYFEITDQNRENRIAKDLLSGHVLYYLKSEEKTASAGDDGELAETTTVKYTWIKDGKFHIDIPEAKAGVEYEYSIYWVWPLNLGTVILNSGDEFLNGNTVEFDDIDPTGGIRNAVVQDMYGNPQKYFYSSLTEGPLDKTYPEVQKILEIHRASKEYRSYDKQLFVDLSSYYNQADMDISDHVSFIRISLKYLGKTEVENEKEESE